jgi:guanylate kinase
MDEAIRAGRTFLLEIEVAGTRQLREKSVAGVYLFISPPSIEELKNRLVRRGTNTEQDIESRVRIAREEIEAAQQVVAGRPLYDHMIPNVDLEQTIARVAELIGVRR